MIKILFAVFDRFSHDQRAIETIQALSMIGNVTVVSYDKISNVNNVKFVDVTNGKRNYLAFKKALKREYKKLNPDLVFLHDNYTSFFIEWVKKRNKNTIVGYDSSELYYDKCGTGVKGLKMALLNNQEKKYIQKADFVFAANLERAMIMKDYFRLKKMPIIWDNVHRIDDDIDYSECEKKYDFLFKKQENIILYCGGIHENRGTFDLIRAVEKLGKNYRLIVAGTASEVEKNKFDRMFQESKSKNFNYVGFVSRSELRFLLKKCKISVSLFDFSCVNHIFCASGKVYEALFEGVPVLTSLNPPFKRLCEENCVGVSTNNFVEGIKRIINDYDYFTKNIKAYIKKIEYDNRIIKLKEIIEDEIKMVNKNE